MDEAAPLDGTELMEIVQGGKNVRVDSARWLRITQIATAWVTALAIVLGVGWNTLFAKTSDYAENPVGVMTEYAGSTAPAGWDLCQGQLVSRTGTYAALFAVIGTTYGVGDGSTTFNLPDMREASPYGAGTWTTTTGTTHGAITAHDARALGVFADDQGQGHIHAFTANGTNYTQLGGKSGAGANAPAYAAGDSSIAAFALGITSPYPDGTNGTPRTGTVTRGKTIGLNYIIKH
jgi:microcystin-dependent protein